MICRLPVSYLLILAFVARSLLPSIAVCALCLPAHDVPEDDKRPLRERLVQPPVNRHRDGFLTLLGRLVFTGPMAIMTIPGPLDSQCVLVLSGSGGS